MSEHPSCYNRPAFKSEVVVQNGWRNVHAAVGCHIRVPFMQSIPDPMSKDCKQWGELGEARLNGWNCDGCKWKPT